MPGKVGCYRTSSAKLVGTGRGRRTMTERWPSDGVTQRDRRAFAREYGAVGASGQ